MKNHQILALIGLCLLFKCKLPQHNKTQSLTLADEKNADFSYFLAGDPEAKTITIYRVPQEQTTLPTPQQRQKTLTYDAFRLAARQVVCLDKSTDQFWQDAIKTNDRELIKQLKLAFEEKLKALEPQDPLQYIPLDQLLKKVLDDPSLTEGVRQSIKIALTVPAVKAKIDYQTILDAFNAKLEKIIAAISAPKRQVTLIKSKHQSHHTFFNHLINYLLQESFPGNRCPMPAIKVDVHIKPVVDTTQ